MIKTLTILAALVATPLAADSKKDFSELFGYKLGQSCDTPDFLDRASTYSKKGADGKPIKGTEIKTTFKVLEDSTSRPGLTFNAYCNAADDTIRTLGINISDPEIGSLLLGKTTSEMGREPDETKVYKHAGANYKWILEDGLSVVIFNLKLSTGESYRMFIQYETEPNSEYNALVAAGFKTDKQKAEDKLDNLFN